MTNSDITQKEKREILENDRKVRQASTYHSVAASSVDDERGGRYAHAGRSTTVVGSSPISYPAQPAQSPWHHDPAPDEPPLGYSVEEMEPVGEVHERGPPASSTSLRDAAVSGGPSDGDVSATSVNKPSRRGECDD